MEGMGWPGSMEWRVGLGQVGGAGLGILGRGGVSEGGDGLVGQVPVVEEVAHGRPRLGGGGRDGVGGGLAGPEELVHHRRPTVPFNPII